MSGTAPRVLAAAVARALGSAPLVVLPEGPRTVVAVDPVEVRRVDVGDPSALRGLTPGWWAGGFGYEFGRPSTVDRCFPDVLLGRFDARLVIGNDRLQVIGTGPTANRLRAAVSHIAPDDDGAVPVPVRAWESDVDVDEWCRRVEHVKDLLRRGECYQLNLTRLLRAAGSVDPIALFGRLAARHDVPYASVVRLDARSIVSGSPECFLRWRGPVVATRPIKGTGRTTDDLVASTKDRVENVMIVDLARADLDLVCEPGSVHPRSLLEPEEHPGIVHLVSTVVGHRREDCDVADLLHAMFPPASVTGVPKPRVLELIETIESRPRGAYCGGIGWIDTEADAGELSVAIRTFTVAHDQVELGVGGGITIASDPRAEWAETELKAERLLALFEAPSTTTT